MVYKHLVTSRTQQVPLLSVNAENTGVAFDSSCRSTDGHACKNFRHRREIVVCNASCHSSETTRGGVPLVAALRAPQGNDGGTKSQHGRQHGKQFRSSGALAGHSRGRSQGFLHVFKECLVEVDHILEVYELFCMR